MSRPCFHTGVGVVLCLFAGACATGSRGGTTAPADARLVYVANEASGVVSVVDVGRRSVEIVDLVDLGYGDNPKPHHIAVEPDGSHWYVTLIGRDRVLKFDRSNQLVDSAAFDVPGMLALVGDDRLVVGRSMSAVNAPQRVGLIERGSMELEEIEVFVPRPHALAADPAGRWVFTGSMNENTLVRLDPRSGRADLTRLAGDQEDAHALMQYAVSPDGRTLVATGERTGMLLVFDITQAPAMRLTHEIEVGPQPWYPVFTPDGSEVWFANLVADQVTVVDVSSWTVADVISGEGIVEPHGIVVSPDGSWVYLSNRNTSGDYVGEGRFGPNAGTLVVIDASTHRVLDVIEVPHYGAGVAVAGAP